MSKTHWPVIGSDHQGVGYRPACGTSDVFMQPLSVQPAEVDCARCRMTREWRAAMFRKPIRQGADDGR